MQSDVLTDEYTKKLNKIIEFFKAEKEGHIYFQNLGIEEGRFNFNLILSTIVIFIGISNALLIADLKFKYSALILLVIVCFMIVYLLFDLSRSSKKRLKHIVEETNKYNFIINYLQSLKTLSYEVDLSKLTDSIKYRYHFRPPPFLDEDNFNEVMDCFTLINKEIFEKEATTSSQNSQK